MNLKIIRRFPDITSPGFTFEKWDTQFHTHNVILNGNYSEIYYPVHWTPLSVKCAFGGTEFYETSKVKYGVDDKRYLILNEGTMYNSCINSENKVESFTINFTRDFVSDVFGSLSSGVDITGEQKTPPEFFEQLYPHDDFTIKIFNNLRALINNKDSDENMISEILHSLLERMFSIHLTSLTKAVSLNAVKYSTRMEMFRRLNYAKDYMYSNYAEKIDLEMLAKVACLSQHHFLRSFKDAFRKTPHKFLTEIRIEAAKDLLISSGKPISEICQQVGFESLSSFGVLFKKYYGMPPEKFRLVQLKKAIFE